MVGKPISITHQPTGRTCHAAVHAVEYRRAPHDLVLHLDLPDGLPRDAHTHQWQLTEEPTYTLAEAPPPIPLPPCPTPMPDQLRLNNIDLTPYIHGTTP